MGRPLRKWSKNNVNWKCWFNVVCGLLWFFFFSPLNKTEQNERCFGLNVSRRFIRRVLTQLAVSCEGVGGLLVMPLLLSEGRNKPGSTNSWFAGDIVAVSGCSHGGNLAGTGNLTLLLGARLILLLINLIHKGWGLQQQIFLAGSVV